MKRIFFLYFLLAAASLLADGPTDNITDKVRPVPPPGVEIPSAIKTELEEAVLALEKKIQAAEESLKNQTEWSRLLPDVQIFHKAVDWAVRYNEFYHTNEFAGARDLLKRGQDRLDLLLQKKAPWLQEKGLVVRGYRSKIDDSIQPYGLVIPTAGPAATGFRLDTWFHGRGEKLTELSFLNDRLRNPGEFTPPGAVVLHLYGRYCNANKLAGEIDLFEAMDHLKKDFPIDENRQFVRGFSMGGAACWQFAVHYPSLWAGAAPGAGFSETPDFLKVFQQETLLPTPWEKKLWHLYDCTDYALNLFNLPTVAYSGEKDRQKQAADIMAQAMAKEGLQLMHLIGPNTDHRYHPQSKVEIERKLQEISFTGRHPVPQEVRFVTWTLRYPESFWVKLQGLEQHWEMGRVQAKIEAEKIKVETKNISALQLSFPAGQAPFSPLQSFTVVLDDTAIPAQPVWSDRSWKMNFVKSGGKWTPNSPAATLRKKPGLQGPVDDAFLDSFLMVAPTGSSLNPALDQWTQGEMKHALDHWRSQYRGEAKIKNDVEVTEQDLARHNLVLWGDPQSNEVLKKIASRLPVRWDAQGVHTPDANYPVEQYAPILIYPNPLNPEKYVVVNSGFTFREYDYLNNARQVPKLPDFAIVDLRTPPNSRYPGKIAVAGFFGEQWEWKGVLKP